MIQLPASILMTRTSFQLLVRRFAPILHPKFKSIPFVLVQCASCRIDRYVAVLYHCTFSQRQARPPVISLVSRQVSASPQVYMGQQAYKMADQFIWAQVHQFLDTRLRTAPMETIWLPQLGLEIAGLSVKEESSDMCWLQSP